MLRWGYTKICKIYFKTGYLLIRIHFQLWLSLWFFYYWILLWEMGSVIHSNYRMATQSWIITMKALTMSIWKDCTLTFLYDYFRSIKLHHCFCFTQITVISHFIVSLHSFCFHLFHLSLPELFPLSHFCLTNLTSAIPSCTCVCVHGRIRDFRSPNEGLIIQCSDVVLFEGILVFYFPEIRDLFNMRLFVDTDPDIRLSRRGSLSLFCLCMQLLWTYSGFMWTIKCIPCALNSALHVIAFQYLCLYLGNRVSLTLIQEFYLNFLCRETRQEVVRTLRLTQQWIFVC